MAKCWTRRAFWRFSFKHFRKLRSALQIGPLGRRRTSPEAGANSCVSISVARLLRNATIMRFALEVGETETNHLEFEFNQLLGSTVIKVNNKQVKKSVRLFSEP